MAIAVTVCRFCMVVLLVVLPGQCAPRSKGSKSGHRSSGPQTVYDQKQTGEYNIQLHLKDFQIFALLSDDYFGGDYDYNYDEADFTLKPSTHKPITEAPSSQQPPISPAPEKPSSSPIPPTAVSNPTSPPKEPAKTQEKPLTNKNPDKPATPETNEVGKPSPTLANTAEEVVEIIESSTVPQREKIEEPNSPGKIKVQIIETPVGIVPGEIHQKDGDVKNGETQQEKRCAAGFSRDKLGRCRRFRRPGSASPHLPYSFSRLANNLASRLRQASSEESQPSSESIED